MSALARATRTLLFGSAFLAAAGTAGAQTIDGIVVIGANQRPVATTKLALLDRKQVVLDTTTTDVFGGFTFTMCAPSWQAICAA